MTDKVIARFVVDQAAEMTEEGRKEIADWLRRQAESLEEEGHNYATNYVARYIINVEAPKKENADG